MIDEYILDAHTLIWYLMASPRLGVNARAVLHDAASWLILPVIALAEACWAVQRGKTSIPSVAAMLADVDNDPRITVAPLDRAIHDRSFSLTTIPEIHDRLIVATALQRAGTGASVALLTCDQNMVASGLVPIMW